MMNEPVRMVCSGCGNTVDVSKTLPFRCPSANADDSIDHVLSKPLHSTKGEFTLETPVPLGEENPFIRYRSLLLSHSLACQSGVSDSAYVELVESLDSQVAAVDGKGFKITPFGHSPTLSDALECSNGGEVWVKNETGNVGGSHKARHLMGVMIYLKVAELIGLPVAQGLRDRRLAIASCGNAALAAAIVARAADWPLDVFIPPDAEPSVVRILKDLGAACHIMARESGQAGDPCYHAFRRAIETGSLPFGVQGNEVGLAIEGGQTLGWEMAEILHHFNIDLDILVVQVGGGALGSSCYQGLQRAQSAGLIDHVPRFYTVQTTGAYPLKHAFTYFMGEADPTDLPGSLRYAAQNRADYMKPWPTEPHSVAHGILDDETYDWLTLIEAMSKTGGDALVVSENRLREANRISTENEGLSVSHTGSAGLAGLMDLQSAGIFKDGIRAAVLLTGIGRD